MRLGAPLRRWSLLTALAVLTGCVSFGGNVRGRFSCLAPDGVCAPSSTIDDRALAMISGDAGAGLADTRKASSIRSTVAAQQPTARPAPSRPVTHGGTDASRTQERVLRIVFLPYVDDRGWLHDESVLYTVVAGSQWQGQSLALARSADRAGEVPVSIADAVEKADGPAGDSMANMQPPPDPAAIAAARARQLNPIADIKRDVAAKLAKPPSAPRSHAPGMSPAGAPTVVTPGLRASTFPAGVSGED